MKNRMITIGKIFILLLISICSHAEELKKPETIAYDFTKISDGIYLATPNGKMAVINNSVVIVNDKEVMLVDSSSSPAAARAVIADIKTLTDRPIRYVINTHYHFDHAHGNQVFGPDVEIIGHEYTREQLLGDIFNSKTYMAFVGSFPQQIKELQRQIANESDPKKKEEQQSFLNIMVGILSAEAETKPTPPNLTFRDHLTLFRGDREIRLLFLGKGHTGGDIFIYLPKEKVLCTGDFIGSGLPYMGDGYIDIWDDTLEELKSIDFDIILPGHGGPLNTKEKINHLQAYLRDLWNKTIDMKRNGASAEEVANEIDLTVHRENYPEITGPGANILAIERIYELLESRDKTRN